MIKEVHLFSLKSLFWDIKIHVQFHSTFHWLVDCFEFRTEISCVQNLLCPKINSLPTLSSLISMQHYNFSKSGGDFSRKSKWLRLLHTGIPSRNFFHFTIIPPWSWVSRDLYLFVWSTVFQPKWNDIKNLQKLSKSSEKLLFFGILSEFVQFWLENSGPNQLDELKWIILLLLKPKPSLEAE